MAQSRKDRPFGYTSEVKRGAEGHGYHWSEMTSYEKSRMQRFGLTGQDPCLETVPVSYAPAARPKIDPEVESKFTALRDRWLSESAFLSSTTEMVLLPSYQAIIGMGPAVVPLLLRELERSVDYWFWALHAITQADPADPKDSGDWKAIAAAWLAWGKSQGHAG